MAQTPETRPSLVLRLGNARDDAAWSEFLLNYEPVILRLMKRSGLQEGDARDVCQQVLAAVAKDVENWRPDDKPASFRRWLFSIARNRILKFLATERRRIASPGGSDAIERLQSHADPRTPIDDQIDREYRQEMLLLAGAQIRGEFQESTWRAFWLTCVDGRSAADAAAELGTTVGNVYVARSRIIARLRQKVKELEGSE